MVVISAVLAAAAAALSGVAILLYLVTSFVNLEK